MHFCTLVIIRPEADDIEAECAELLAPFDDNLEVDEYEAACWCVGELAQNDALEFAAQTVGSMETIRERFNATWNAEQKRLHTLDFGLQRELMTQETEEFALLRERLHRAWQEAVAPFKAAEQAALERNPYRDQPNPDCQECGGTGQVLTTSNPHGQWDWYQIGGRYTGWLDSDYDPTRDNANWETCDICGGTGVRTDFAYYFEGDVLVASWRLDPIEPADDGENAQPGIHIMDGDTGTVVNVTAPDLAPLNASDSTGDVPVEEIPPGAEQRPWCNGCRGQGKRLKWPTQWENHMGDIMPVCALPKDVMPYAIVTPDGEWHDQDGAGVNGVSEETRDDETPTAWQRKCRGLFDEHMDCIAVVCDLHC